MALYFLLITTVSQLRINIISITFHKRNESMFLNCFFTMYRCKRVPHSRCRGSYSHLCYHASARQLEFTVEQRRWIRRALHSEQRHSAQQAANGGRYSHDRHAHPPRHQRGRHASLGRLPRAQRSSRPLLRARLARRSQPSSMSYRLHSVSLSTSVQFGEDVSPGAVPLATFPLVQFQNCYSIYSLVNIFKEKHVIHCCVTEFVYILLYI